MSDSDFDENGLIERISAQFTEFFRDKIGTISFGEEERQQLRELRGTGDTGDDDGPPDTDDLASSIGDLVGELVRQEIRSVRAESGAATPVARQEEATTSVAGYSSSTVRFSSAIAGALARVQPLTTALAQAHSEGASANTRSTGYTGPAASAGIRNNRTGESKRRAKGPRSNKKRGKAAAVAARGRAAQSGAQADESQGHSEAQNLERAGRSAVLCYQGGLLQDFDSAGVPHKALRKK